MSRSDRSDAGREDERILRRLFELQERDRQLVAYEIHDGFVQQATAALLHLQGFRELLPQEPGEAWKAFEAAVQSLREALEEARRVMAGLRPLWLEEAGLLAALEDLVGRLGRRGRPQIELSHAGAMARLDPAVETAVFRIVQEALTNACRHSRSEKVRVEVAEIGDRLHVEIQDWGVGFDPAAIDLSRFGLRGIHERARLLGGQATIETAPGQGTRIIIDVPLRGHAAASPT